MKCRLLGDIIDSGTVINAQPSAQMIGIFSLTKRHCTTVQW
ncbi:MAG: hypothetical protein ACLRRA_07940 [Acutalibacteraceae bacterium]